MVLVLGILIFYDISALTNNDFYVAGLMMFMHLPLYFAFLSFIVFLKDRNKKWLRRGMLLLFLVSVVFSVVVIMHGILRIANGSEHGS